MSLPEEQHESALRAWDWRAALRAEERSIPWLARQTARSPRTVFAYAEGLRRPPSSWLRAAADVLGFRPAG